MKTFLRPESLWLDLMPFEAADSLQRQIHHEVLAAGPGIVLGLQHPTVVTLGLRGNEAQDVMGCDPSVRVMRADRGGQATLHSPGQLVIYPILPFKRMGLMPREYVCLLLQTTADFYRELGIEAVIREDRAGVYTPHGKIAFCGLRLEKGVSRHGLSLNLSNDLNLFGNIRICGNALEPLTSLRQELPGRPCEMPLHFAKWMQLFERNMRRIMPCAEAPVRAI